MDVASFEDARAPATRVDEPMFLQNPAKSVRDTPITSGALVLISIYCEWTGVYLLNAHQIIPTGRLATYLGPTSIVSLSNWGWLFIGSGVCMGLRLCLHPARWRISLTLHILAMMVSFGWAVSFDLGPYAVSQPAFTLLALLVFFLPFLPRLIDSHNSVGAPLE